MEAELRRREKIWKQLLSYDPARRVPPSVLTQLGIQRGQQGIFRDLERTRHLTSTGSGVAVGIRHTGSTYADELDDDALIYHYPVTGRGARDRNEIESIWACAQSGLPLFAVITPEEDPSVREVRLGWVASRNDEAREFLISFSPSDAYHSPEGPQEESPFELTQKRHLATAKARARPGQSRFRHRVISRYGLECAFCSIGTKELLQAAHVRDLEHDGSDDPRNGLVICLNHHQAFDRFLVCIEPGSGDFRAGPRYSGTLTALGVSKRGLPSQGPRPHPDALTWKWAMAGLAD